MNASLDYWKLNFEDLPRTHSRPYVDVYLFDYLEAGFRAYLTNLKAVMRRTKR
jgi:hypothetical protein